MTDKENKADSNEYEGREARLHALDLVLRNEELDISGFKRFFQETVDMNSKYPRNALSIKKAIRWGKLMQFEMKKQGLQHLTPQLIEETRERADAWGILPKAKSYLLLTSWKHGGELAKIEGYVDMQELSVLKACRSDRTAEFCDKYKASQPKDFEEAADKCSKILAAVFQDEELVSKFHVMLSDPDIINPKPLKERAKEYIPILELPDNTWPTLRKVCKQAICSIQETKAKAAEKSSNSFFK